MLLISKCGQEIVSHQHLNFKQTAEIVNDVVTDFQISNQFKFKNFHLS